MQIKSFILAQSNDNRYCQDSIALDYLRNRYAVTDGVSNSNHPQFFSSPLSRILVENGCPYEEDGFRKLVLEPASQCWRRNLSEKKAKLSGRKLMQTELLSQDFIPGASTFLLLEIDNENKKAEYHILGDSTMFVVSSNGCIQSFSTNKKENKDGRDVYIYNNYPNYVCANGVIFGNILTGSIPIPQGGYIMLMTDGMAEWFQEESFKDASCVDRLWNMDSDADFMDLANNARSQDKMDDDLALVMIYFDDALLTKKNHITNYPTIVHLNQMPKLPALILPPLFPWMTPHDNPIPIETSSMKKHSLCSCLGSWFSFFINGRKK